MGGYAIGVLTKSFAVALEKKKQEIQAELDRQEARRKQHKDFMELVDTISDYKIQVSAASIYLTHGGKAAHAFIVDELQKTKE
jgi:hypothetical protein